jgi:FkbM family methyltransferase
MEEEKNILFYSKISRKTKFSYKYKNRIQSNNTTKIFIFVLFLALILIIIGIFFYILHSINSKKVFKVNELDSNLFLNNISNNYSNISLVYDEFDENINKQYILIQNNFCNKEEENKIQKYENLIKIAKVDFNSTNFSMYVYKTSDTVSRSIMYSHNWEANNTKKILKALEYYSEKKKLNKKDIYLIDIGANVGWYTYFLGKIGYNIMSFEASKINNYILYKNYCLNRDINVTIINKGLDVEDKKCKLKIVSYNIGDGMILCDNRDKLILDFNGEIFDDIELTKLGKYTKFLSEKNLAFIKLDVEGAEGTVFEGGKEIIDKYHVPFIMMEFEVRLLESHGTKVLNFLEFFENNGYKFSLIDFFSKEYISSSELIQIKRNKNLFVVYEKILE